jgi:hypothetical protein
VGSREAVSWLVCGAIALVLVGLVLLGGEGGTATNVNGGSSSEDQAGTEIEGLLTRFFTVNDPAQCTDDVTPALLRQNFPGPDPLQSCQRVNTDDQDTFTESVQVDDVAVQGPTARASIRLSGGQLDGSKVTVSLIETSGRWQVDRLAVAQLDRAGFDRAVRSQILKGGATPSEADCFVGTLDRNVSDQELSRAILNASARSRLTAGWGCISRATLLRELDAAIAQRTQSENVPSAVVQCIVDRLTQGMSDSQLRAFLRAGGGNVQQATQVRAIAAACAQDYANGVLPQSGTS